MVAEMVLEGEIDVYVEHGVEEPNDIAIHMIEGPPENGEEIAGEHADGENGENAEGENVENGENVDGQGGDDFVEVEEDEERVHVEEDDSEFSRV
ncbi:hypothetical protein COLO4_07691 [Corchorus olitorius]|uniref:Uncharacterized protein n=1 Tax=Corchorus olitorius TaxID=93759 RepID=A0A1R3KIW3_9ROSI|nr:hypothetical protein COLO4_07691 [Corchorus olitorius]